MAFQRLDGFTGFQVSRVSSMDKRTVGKFTDTNHLSSLHFKEPQWYDKKVISLYTQTSLYSNDFDDMIDKNEPYYLDGQDTFQWEINAAFKFPKILEVPGDTMNMAKPGIDGQEFQLVFDTIFSKHSVIKSNKYHGPQFYVTTDPTPYNSGHLHTLTLITENPKVDFVPKFWLAQGIEYTPDSWGQIGEFDQELRGLPGLGDKIKMFDSIGAEDGFEHTITGWAQDKAKGFTAPRDNQGNPLDLLVYYPKRNGQAVQQSDVRWEPFIEQWMKTSLFKSRTSKRIWSRPGTMKSEGSKNEIKKQSAGVYWRIRNNGNYVPYNRGDFRPSLFRTVFGDLFYRRVDIADRKVRIYTNEAGFDVFDQALKADAFGSGLNFTVTDRSDSNRFIEGQGQNLVMNFGFSGMVTRETGRITLTHLKELDLPQTNTEFGQNKKSSPLFIVFDVSPTSSGTLGANVREIRYKDHPALRWGWIDGLRSHLGAKASVGMNSANMFDGYKLWMKDRSDVFIEDASRCVIIEEIPYI